MRGRLAVPVLWLLAVAAAAQDVVLALQRPDLFPDLDVYRVASGTVGEGGSRLYDVIGSNGGPFTYPPAAAVVLWPLRLPPMAVAGVLLAALTVAATVLTARLAARTSPSWAVPALVLGALLTVPFRTTVFFGQLGAVLLALVALDLLEPHPIWPRGLLVGVAGAIKLTPLLFVPYLWISGRRRDAAVATGTFAAVTGIGALALPAASQRYWTDDLWQFGRVGELNGAHNRSVWGVLGSYGVPRAATAALAVTLVVVGLRRARSLDRAGDLLAAVTVVGLLSCVVSPITWSHHLVWLLPAAACLLRAPWPGLARAAATAAILVAYWRFSGDARLLTLVEAAATCLLVFVLPAAVDRTAGDRSRWARGDLNPHVR